MKTLLNLYARIATVIQQRVERHAIGLPDGFRPGIVLPAAHDHIDVLRIQFDQPRRKVRLIST